MNDWRDEDRQGAGAGISLRHCMRTSVGGSAAPLKVDWPRKATHANKRADAVSFGTFGMPARRAEGPSWFSCPKPTPNWNDPSLGPALALALITETTCLFFGAAHSVL